VELRSPICIAAGPWGTIGIDKSCVGSYTTKSVTPDPREGNSGETFVTVDNGYINRMGLPSPGVDAWIDQYESVGIPTFVSLALFGLADVEKALKRLENLPDVIGVELNVSCPMVSRKYSDLPNILGVIKRKSDLFVTIKASPTPISIRRLNHLGRSGTLDGIVVANSIPATTFLQKAPFSGGMSGPVVAPVVMDLVKNALKRANVPIIACGGISSGQDVVEYMALGAKYVQIGSAHIKEPDCTTRIMAEYLDLQANF